MKRYPTSKELIERVKRADRELFSSTQLGALFRLPHCTITTQCDQGLIPFVKRLGHGWYITREGALFIAHWLGERKALGSLWKGIVKIAAAKADAACAERQAEHIPEDRKRRNLQLPEVLDIRKRLERGEHYAKIADDYDRDGSTILHVGSGRSHPLGKLDKKIIALLESTH